MPARPRLLRALVGPALAGLPAALAFSPGLPAADPLTPGPGFQVALEAGAPGGGGLTQRVQLASDGGNLVAAVGGEDGATRLVQLRPGRSPRFIRTFPRGALNPTVGTDADGRVVVLAQTCRTRREDGARGGTGCTIEVIDAATGRARPLPGGSGAHIAAMDRGAVVVATGRHLRLIPAPGPDGRPGPSIVLPNPSAAREGTDVGEVAALDLRGAVVAAVFELRAAFGGSQLARFDPGRGWSTLGVSTDGGAAIGHRAFYAPTITATGVRAFFDGAEDFPGYAGRWSTATKPLREVRAAPLGNPVHLRSAAFLGNRLLVFTTDDSCDLDDCRIASYGPFPLG